MVKRVKALPSYDELADLVCKLTENNIANLDKPECRFVKCFTFDTGQAPDHWHLAIAVRELLITNKIVPRQVRTYCHNKIKNMRTVARTRK